jgi:hypothetical protein
MGLCHSGSAAQVNLALILDLDDVELRTRACDKVDLSGSGGAPSSTMLAPWILGDDLCVTERH